MRFRSGLHWQRWLNVAGIPKSLSRCPDFADTSSRGRAGALSRTRGRRAAYQICSYYRNSSSHSDWAEWDTNLHGDAWHAIVLYACEWTGRGELWLTCTIINMINNDFLKCNVFKHLVVKPFVRFTDKAKSISWEQLILTYVIHIHNLLYILPG